MDLMVTPEEDTFGHKHKKVGAFKSGGYGETDQLDVCNTAR